MTISMETENLTVDPVPDSNPAVNPEPHPDANPDPATNPDDDPDRENPDNPSVPDPGRPPAADPVNPEPDPLTKVEILQFQLAELGLAQDI